MIEMTSEREAFGRWFYASKYAQVALPGADDVQRAWDAWQARAHLAQPAQAVDVGAIREVIKRLEEHPLSDEWKVFDQCADKLTRALTGEKAAKECTL